MKSNSDWSYVYGFALRQNQGPYFSFLGETLIPKMIDSMPMPKPEYLITVLKFLEPYYLFKLAQIGYVF